MAITDEDIHGDFMLFDIGPYSYLCCFPYAKWKELLAYPNKDRTAIIYGRHPSVYCPSDKCWLLKKAEALEILNTATFEFGRIPKEGNHITEELIKEVEKPKPLPESVLCIVGNIVGAHPVGEDKHIVYGTKQFKQGAKVYCKGFHHYSDRMFVTGHPRKGNRLITILLNRNYVTNFRIKVEYSPSVIEKLVRDHVAYTDREEAEWDLKDFISNDPNKTSVL